MRPFWGKRCSLIHPFCLYMGDLNMVPTTTTRRRTLSSPWPGGYAAGNVVRKLIVFLPNLGMCTTCNCACYFPSPKATPPATPPGMPSRESWKTRGINYIRQGKKTLQTVLWQTFSKDRSRRPATRPSPYWWTPEKWQKTIKFPNRNWFIIKHFFLQVFTPYQRYPDIVDTIRGQGRRERGGDNSPDAQKSALPPAYVFYVLLFPPRPL